MDQKMFIDFGKALFKVQHEKRNPYGQRCRN